MLGFCGPAAQTVQQKTATAAWDIEMGMIPEQAEQSPAQGICKEIGKTGLWRLWLVLAMFYTCKLSPMCPFTCGWSSDDSNFKCLENDSQLVCLLESGLLA